MATWEQIIADEEFQSLPTSGQQLVRQQWYDATVLPELKATGIDEVNLNNLRNQHITEYDNGQGYISSFASAAGRGAASTFTSAVQGVGALTGSEAIEQAARDMDTAVTENLTVNPSMEKTNFTGNVLGNVAGFLAPGMAGMRIGRALGAGAELVGGTAAEVAAQTAARAASAQLGGRIAANTTMLASGAGSGAQQADRYGIQGPERMGMVLGNAATEMLSENIFGLGSELNTMSRLAGLGGLGANAARRTGGFLADVGENTVEEIAANVGSNLVASTFAPEGVKTPGILEGNVEAGAGGAIGGAFFGGVNLMRPLPPVAPRPSEAISAGVAQQAAAANDPEAAAAHPGAKFQPTPAPQVPGTDALDPAFDSNRSDPLAPAAGALPPPPGFAETTPAEAFPAALPQGLPAAAAVPGAVPEAFPAADTLPPAPARALPAAEALPELDISLQAGAYTGDLLQGKEVIGEGSESTVYRDGDSVIKVSEPYNDNSEETFQARVDRAMDIDNLIGDGTLSVEGFYRSKNGTKNPVFRQTFAEGRPATREEIQAYMESRGFQVKEAGTTTDTFVKVSDGMEITASDLDGANVVVGTDGKFHVIDADLVRRPSPTQTAPVTAPASAVPPVGEPVVAGRFTGVTEAPPTELFHSGELPEGLDSIDPMRTTGAKQGKRGRDFGGFYAGPAETAAKYKGPKNRLAIAPGARAMRVAARGAIERLSLKDRQDLLDQGVDIISGIDIRGLPESVILNKDVILSVELDTQTAPAATPVTAPAGAVPPMTEQAPPVTPQTPAVPPAAPAVASQGATPSDLIDQTGRLTVEGAQSMIEAIQSLGLTTAPFVINNTGVAPGVNAAPSKGSTDTVDGKPVVFLNQERMTLDTPLHETTHLLTPTLFTEQRALYDVGAALLADSPLRQAIVNRYVTEAGMTMSPEQITEEAMVTGLANNGAEWLRAYAGNAKMTRAIKEFLAKVREWFDDLMYSKGFNPNMSLEQFYKKVNRQILAGKLQQRATNAPVQAMSLADIEKLKSPTGIPLAAFASRYAKDIKPADKTLADADRIASEKLNEVNQNPGSLLPTATAQGVREYHTRILIQPDGKTYDPNNLNHADATPEVLAIYEMRQNGSSASMEQQEADRVNQIRQDDLKKLTNYLKGNTDYSPSEAMVMVLAASKYGVRSKKTDDVVTFTAVEITDKNQVMVPVVDGTMVPRLRDKMATGMSMKKALEAAYTDAMDAQVQANRDNRYEGLVKFRQSQNYEDAVALNKACAGTPWCTGASTTTAETHINGGDFYVYFEGGIAQVAFRMDGNDKLAEPPRGNYEGQALNERQAEIADKVLRGGEIPGGQGFLSDRDFISKVKNDLAGMTDDEVFMGMFASRKSENGYGPNARKFPESVKIALEGQYNLRDLRAKGYYMLSDDYPSTAVAVYSLMGRRTFYPNLRLVALDVSNNEGELNLPALTTVGGNVSGNVGDIKFPNLITIGGGMSSNKGSINLPALTTIGGEVSSNEKDINLPALTTVGKSVWFNKGDINLPALTTIGASASFNNGDLNFPELTKVSGSVSNNAGNLNFPTLTTVGGEVARNTKDLNFTALTTVAGGVSINYGDLNFPALITVGDSVNDNNGNLNFPKLTTIRVDVSRNTKDLNFPALTTVGGDVAHNSGIIFPALATVGGGVYRNSWNLDFPSLTTVGEGVYNNDGNLNFLALTTIGGNLTSNLGELNFPSLTTVGEKISRNVNDLNLPKLTTVGTDVSNNEGSLNFPALTTVGGSVYRNEKNLNFPKLTKVGADVSSNTGDLNMPVLATVGGIVSRNTGDLNMPLLETEPVFTGKYAEQTGASQAPDTRFSLAPATPQDKAYVAAVESGDVKTQQKLVDDAAEAAGVPSVGVNINDGDSDYTGMILRGEKTVETRDTENNALKKYVGKRVGIVRTGIKKAKAAVVGYATVGEPVRYNSEEEFAADFTRHRVTGGKFAFSGFKIGYPMVDVTPIDPYDAPEAPGQTVIKTRPIHEPVAYDENDKIILPSQRFDNFTRYSLAPAEQKVDAKSVEAEFSPQTPEEQTAYDKASSNTVTARNPYLAVAAVRMRGKKLTVDRYAELVENLDPFTVKGAEKIPTEAKILQYISSEKTEKVMQPIPEGTLTEFRIDIPTYNSSTAKGDTVYAITGHEPVGATATRVGKPISYLGAAKVTNAVFSTRSISGKGSAVDIAAGAGKFPLATVKGNYESITSLPQNINDSKVWTEVGYNPIRSSGFVDVRSNKYVVGGSEAIMVGPRVFVKDPVFEFRPTGFIGPDTRFSLAPAVTKPSNVARNQAGTRVRVLMENQTYEGQTIPAAMEQALSLYDENVDKGFTVAQHMAFIQELRLNAGRKYQDMTYGAYAGMYTRDLLDESTNPERDPMSQAFAKRESDRIAALMGEQAAIPGRQVKAMDIFDRIANTPEMTVRREEQLLPFDGKQGVKDEFDKAATTVREEMEGLGNEAINTAPEDAMTSMLGQRVAAVVRGEETSNVGEVVLDEVKPAETMEDLPAWFREGQELLGAELSGKIDDLTELLQVYAYLKRKDGTYSLTPEERSANVAARIKKIEDSGKTLEQALAETKKSIDEILSAFNKPKAKAKPKAAPIPKEAPPEGEIQDIVAARINRLLDKIVKPSTSPAKTRTDKEILVDAIVSTMMSKAGLPADLKAGGDNVTLAFGLVVANPQLAAQSVQAVYDLLQSDPASANITSSDKIRGFMQMLTGQSFADGKAYGEKQLNTVLKNELKRLKISVNDVAMDAALTGKTVEQLEASLRDPSRELSKVLSPDALNKVVAAVTGEFRKSAAERADGIRSQQAQARVLQDMIDEKNMVIADFKAARAKKKKAAEDAKKKTKEYEDLWTRLKNGEDKAAIRQAERQVRAAQAAEIKAEADWIDHQSAESEAISMEAQRSSRDLMEQQNKLNATDRKFRLAINRKARKAMRRKLAKRGGFMIPLDQSEAEELLDQKPKTVLQYLAREYGFSLADIIGMARDQDRQTTLEAKVGNLAQALGLTKEQADKFMGPVIAEAMKYISEARKKDVSQRINRVLTPVIGKKKTQKTEAEKLIKLAEMGGLTADNVEKLLLNSKDAKEFTPEFRQKLIDLIAQANDPHLTQVSRDLLKGKFLDEIKAARGITVLGLLGEWTMSNIFMSILSTFKVNFVWGFIKAASDSGIFITISGPAAARADAIAKGVTPAPRLAVAKVLFRQWLRGYAVNMQHNAAFMWSEGRGKDESDFTSQFANTGMELLSRIKDAQIQWSNDGKPLPQTTQKVIRAMAAFGKYTRRTMVASDFINRTSAFEMSKVLEAVKVMQAKGGAASTATIQREIDDALYGGNFKDAFAKANKQADDEIAAKKLGKAERGIRVGEIMDEMLGKNLGMTEKQTQEYLQDSRENAKRWSLANQTEGIFGEISNLMLAATRKIPALKFALPAIRMPIAAFSQTLDWMPYGFLRLYAINKNNNETESFTNYLLNSKNEYGNWNKPVGGVPAYRKTDLMAKASIGSLIMLGLFIKTAISFDEDEDEAEFYITGLGPSDPAENKAWREKGNAPFTFRFNGGTGFRFQESPFYGMLAPIAAWSDANRYGKPGEAESDRIAYAIGKTVSGFQEAVVMKNLSDILAGGSSYSADGQLRNWSKASSRLASNVLMPRLGGEINTILYGPQDQKALGWGGRALANVPFVPSFNNKPAQDFLGREIHTKREGMLGEIYPALAHRVIAPSLDDPILNFVAKMSPNFLATTRRFKDGTRVMDNYEFVRKWNAAAGVKIREYLTPERMASYERKLAKDKPDAQTEFNVEINKIRTAALRKFSEVQF